MGRPTSSICYCQHSSRDHLNTQAPPLRQSRDTFGAVRWIYLEQKDRDVMTLLIDAVSCFVFVWRWIKYQNNYNWGAVCGCYASGLFDNLIIASIGSAWKVHETIFGPLDSADEVATIFRNGGHSCSNKKKAQQPCRILNFRIFL
jgi:hypothetical protein